MTKTSLFPTVLTCVTFTILVCVLGIGQLFAQSTVTGGIRGNVTDQQGASVPNASIKINNLGTNKEDTTNPDADGNYRFNNLQPGIYKILVTSSGFAEFKKNSVIVEVGQVTTVNVPLGIAGTSATVEVTAETPVINTIDNANAININQTSINELPTNGRRASNFVLLTPATVPDGNFGLISFRGISGLLNNSTVDGGDNNQSFQSEERGRTRISYVVSQSAIREFQVNTSNYSAEYGRSAGGVVNTVTKSGTNEFHGDLFEYYRNNKLGARNPGSFQPVLVNGVTTQVALKPVDVRHQFGGTIGGPIIKDRLFFFFSYDQQKRNFPGIARFSNLNYLNTVNTATLTGRGLTTTQINDTLAFITSLTGETPRNGEQKLFLPKIDWQINGSNLFTASYNRLRWDSEAGLQTQATVLNGRRSFGNDFVNVDTLNARLQSTFSSNILNELRFQYSQDHEFALSQEPLAGEPLTATTSQGNRSPQIALTNGLTFGTTTNFERLRYPFEDRLQFADTVTWSIGKHTLKFGGDFNHVTDDIQNRVSETGSYTYANINDFIIDYVNFKSGLPAATVCASSTRNVGRCYTSSYSQGVGIPGLKFNVQEYSFFIQDDFRITPRLTVNLGLRYEYQKLPQAVIPNTSTATIPNDGRTLAEATSTLPNDTNNFGPRLGFAYDVLGDGKTSIRGGIGLYYGRILGGHIWNNLLRTGNPAGQGTVTIAQTVTTNCFPLVPAATAPCAPIFPNVLPNSGLTLAAATINFFEKDFQSPQILQYDFILERQITKNTVVSISYIGSLGRKLPTFVDQNLAQTGNTRTINVYGGIFNGQSFRLPTYTRANSALPSLLRFQSSVKSEYNAFVLQANRRLSNGLQFQASYTLAKSTDTGQNSQITTSIFNQPLDILDATYNFGPSNFDVRHKFVVSAVYAPNFYKGTNNSLGNYFLNGWSIAPIYTFYSGVPFTGAGPNNLNGTNGSNMFPLNRRNSYRNPNLWNVDLRLSKRFRFTERYNLELLAEGFNIFNRTQVSGINFTQYANPVSNNCASINGIMTNDANGVCSQPAFGSIFSTDSNNFRERQVQLAVRFQF